MKSGLTKKKIPFYCNVSFKWANCISNSLSLVSVIFDKSHHNSLKFDLDWDVECYSGSDQSFFITCDYLVQIGFFSCIKQDAKDKCNTISLCVLDMTLNCIQWWDSNSVDHGEPFIAITPRFTLAWNGSTCWVPSLGQIDLFRNH